MTADVVAIWKALFASSGGSGTEPSAAANSGAAASAAGAAAAGSSGTASSSGAANIGGAAGSSGAASSSAASEPERVPTLLVGHSMGGALAVRAAASKEISGLEGVVVIDVVEGTAIGGWGPGFRQLPPLR